MADVKDDPREVLALLNSLGFVGITAQQLKAFMKDLKLYRKIKERERQRWKDEIKKKILSKQRSMIKELYNEEAQNIQLTEQQSTSSNSSGLHIDNSLVQVKIRYIPNDNISEEYKRPEGNHSLENEIEAARKVKQESLKQRVPQKADIVEHVTVSAELPTRRNEFCAPDNLRNHISTIRKSVCSSKSQDIQLASHGQRPCISTETIVKDKHYSEVRRSLSYCKLRSRSATSEPITSACAQSIATIKNSTTSKSCKSSFIRPWHLCTDPKKSIPNKCDPVALYQKYQKEWKRISFPGEARHSSVRWAVREKMLGTEPQPLRPLLRSRSMSSLKKK